MAASVTRDHYEILGVDRKASSTEIKTAYRRLALRYHPDRNAGDKMAEERFKEVSRAYAILGEADKRAHYDRFGTADLPFADDADVGKVTDFFDAIFGDLFGLGRKRAAGQDLRYTLELEFPEAALGCEKLIKFDRTEDCRRCSGTGAEGAAAGLAPCGRCNGQGYTRQRAGFLSARRECLACGGSGEVPRVRCAACAGTGLVDREREYLVRVPPGSLGGTSQRVAGEGSPGRRGGPAGDLFVIVRVRNHPFYRQEGEVLVCEVPVSVTDAALGADIEVPLLDSSVRMRVPPGTQSGAVFRIRGKGLLKATGGRGDAHVKVVVEVPAALSAEGRALAERLAGTVDDGAYPRRQAFREAVRTGVAADEPAGAASVSAGGDAAGGRRGRGKERA
jgi:molecular chaperone DnaJ